MSGIGSLARIMREKSPQSVAKTSLMAFCVCLAGLTILAFAISFMDTLRHPGTPMSNPMFDSSHAFTDLTDYYDRIRRLAEGAEVIIQRHAELNYPPPAIYVYAFFIRLFPDPVIALTFFEGGMFLAGLVVLMRSSLKQSAVKAGWIHGTLFIAAGCSYPFMQVISRGNLEGVLWSFAFLGLVAFVGEYYFTSALFFAAAVCIKPFPGLFFFLLLHRRRYREVAAAASAICIANVAALKALGPSIAIAYGAIRQGFQVYFDTAVVALRVGEMGADHTAFSCIKQVIRVLIHYEPYVPLRPVLIAYEIWLPISGLIIVASGFYFWRKPVLNQVFAIALLMLLIPPVSYDYTLAILYLPWGAFLIFLVGDVGSGRVDFSLKKSLWILIPCAVIFAPEGYFSLNGEGFAGQVKALVEILLLIAVARIDMPASLFGEKAGASPLPP